ncbi:heterokaryon incompatibility protein-domain-containing protein [Nemania sp. FL0031]|nr:heterokaryon incompatibility protein-domain-containing protein [Nemania sp. FL0031]
MRLLNTTNLKFEEFFDVDRCEYAILSHTWGEEEVLYHNIRDLNHDWRLMKGAKKVVKSCEAARRKGFKWIWIDTCCIDKTSSTELSESINSMFKWYEKSAVCIVYLVDVLKDGGSTNISRSRWFQRGWTLQELIAPRWVEFWDCNWAFIDTKHELSAAIAEITGIDELVLQHGHHLDSSSPSDQARIARLSNGGALDYFSPTTSSTIRHLLRSYTISNIMSWASYRQTTRPEDISYCLLGLFDINMPLLYGEGAEKAFYRLQFAIIERSRDQSLLAWERLDHGDSPRPGQQGSSSVFAPSPAFFRHGGKIQPDWSTKYCDGIGVSRMMVRQDGLMVDLLICPCSYSSTASHSSLMPEQYIGILACGFEGRPLSRPAIALCKGPRFLQYSRRNFNLYIVGPGAPSDVRLSSSGSPSLEGIQVDVSKAEKKTILLASRNSPLFPKAYGSVVKVGDILDLDSEKCSIEYLYPTVGDMRYGIDHNIGLISLYKPAYPRFVILWRVFKIEPIVSDTRYVCAVLPLTQLIQDLWPGYFSGKVDEKQILDTLGGYRGGKLTSMLTDLQNGQKLEKFERLTSNYITLSGSTPRKVTATIKTKVFLERCAPELTIEVRPDKLRHKL